MALFVVKNLILLLKEMDLLFLSENMLNRKYTLIPQHFDLTLFISS